MWSSSKMLASTFSAGHAGMKALFLRLLLLPLLMGILWCLYYNTLSVISFIYISLSFRKLFHFTLFCNSQSDSRGFYTKNGLILNILGLSYGAGILSTVILCKHIYVVFF